MFFSVICSFSNNQAQKSEFYGLRTVMSQAGRLSIVVDAVLHSSTHTVVWVNKRKENTSSEKLGGLWEGEGIGGWSRAMIDTRENQKVLLVTKYILSENQRLQK